MLDAADELRAIADALEAAMDFSAQERHEQGKTERLNAMERALPEPAPHQRPHRALGAIREWRKQNVAPAPLPTNWQTRLDAAVDVIAARLIALQPLDPTERKRVQRARELLDTAVTASPKGAAPLNPSDARGKFFGGYLDLMGRLVEGERARRRQV